VEVKVAGELMPRHYCDKSIETISEVKTNRKTKANIKPLRRLRGFVFEFNNTEVIVIFLVDGKEYQYSLPKHLLMRNGISAIDQPFQMDEIEIEDENGVRLETRFQPMAKTESGSYSSFKLSEEEQDWFQTVLKHKYVEV
jgi:hypothetical protein